jgi:hypothetical protein
MADFNTADLVTVKIGNYRTQMQSLYGQPDVWRTTYMESDEDRDRTVPAVFSDIVDAEQFTNHMRDENPEATYRVIRDVTITEVVHI